MATLCWVLCSPWHHPVSLKVWHYTAGGVPRLSYLLVTGVHREAWVTQLADSKLHALDLYVTLTSLVKISFQKVTYIKL